MRGASRRLADLPVRFRLAAVLGAPYRFVAIEIPGVPWERRSWTDACHGNGHLTSFPVALLETHFTADIIGFKNARVRHIVVHPDGIVSLGPPWVRLRRVDVKDRHQMGGCACCFILMTSCMCALPPKLLPPTHHSRVLSVLANTLVHHSL